MKNFRLPQIEFDEAAHVYTVAGRRTQSVTTVLKEIKPEFDAQRMSLRVARRTGRRQEQILAEWAEKGRVARDMGHEVHKHIEDTIRYSKQMEMNGVLPPVPMRNETRAFNEWWAGAKESLSFLAAEYMVADTELGVAGTVDAFFESSKSGMRICMDWKTGKQFRCGRDSYDDLLAPFEDLPNNEFHVYSLQCSIYRLIMERAGGEETGDPFILWLPPEGEAQYFRAMDLRDRVEAWLRGRKARES